MLGIPVSSTRVIIFASMRRIWFSWCSSILAFHASCLLPQHFLHFDDGCSALEPRSTPRSALGQPLFSCLFAEPFDPFPFAIDCMGPDFTEHWTCLFCLTGCGSPLLKRPSHFHALVKGWRNFIGCGSVKTWSGRGPEPSTGSWSGRSLTWLEHHPYVLSVWTG